MNTESNPSPAFKSQSAAPNRQRRTCVRNGRYQQFSIDPETASRIAWCGHVLREVVAVPASGSSVVRRAVALYTQHLEQLLRSPVGIGKEQREVLRANLGSDTQLDQADILSVPVRPFTDLLRAHFETPALLDLMEQDVARWAAEKAAGKPLSPSLLARGGDDE